MRGGGAVLVGVLVCACSGDDDGGEATPLQVVEVTPADGASEVELDEAVTVVFNRAIDPATVDGAAFVSDAYVDVAVDGATVTLTPQGLYRYLHEHEVVVRTDVRDLEGVELESAYSSVFTTRFRRWEPRVVLGDGPVGEPGGPHPYPGPQLAATSTGRLIAVWQQEVAGDLQVSSAVYEGAAEEWSEVEALGQSGMAMNPQLASNEEGWMLAVWIEQGTVKSALVDSYGSSFQPVGTVHEDEALVGQVAAAVSTTGNQAVALTSSGNVSVFRRFSTGPWSGEVLGVGSAPAVAVSNTGTAWVLWTSSDGSEVTARVFDGESWTAAEPLWTAGVGHADRVRLVFGPSGAIATWGVTRPDGADVHVRIYQSGVWGDDEIVGTVGSGDALPEVAVNSRGEVLVSWQDAGGGLFARWRRDGSWAAVDSISDLPALLHPIALDADGNAMVTYSVDHAAYYQAATDTWIESELPLDTNLIIPSFLGTDPMVVGQQEGGVGSNVHSTIYR
jgi:hypothetical protein